MRSVWSSSDQQRVNFSLIWIAKICRKIWGGKNTTRDECWSLWSDPVINGASTFHWFQCNPGWHKYDGKSEVAKIWQEMNMVRSSDQRGVNFSLVWMQSEVAKIWRKMNTDQCGQKIQREIWSDWASTFHWDASGSFEGSRLRFTKTWSHYRPKHMTVVCVMDQHLWR